MPPLTSPPGVGPDLQPRGLQARHATPCADVRPAPPSPVILGTVLLSGPGEVNLSQNQEILFVAGAVVLCVVVGFIAAHFGRRSGRRAISQRLAALGTRLGLDPPEDEYNIETSLAYLEQVTGGAAQAVTESSSDAIRLRRSLDTLTQGVVLCDENGTVIYRNGRANALMVSRHGDALAAQAVTEMLEDAWHEGSAERRAARCRCGRNRSTTAAGPSA
jgi:PAS domain-containing protein